MGLELDNDRLAAFLERRTATPWAWGRADCALFAADWILEARGFDPAADWRGRYATALGCRRLLKKRGGLAAVFAGLAARHGFAERTEGEALMDGDVGVLTAIVREGRRDVPGEVAAVRFGPRWAVFTPAGVHVVRAPLARAWAI